MNLDAVKWHKTTLSCKYCLKWRAHQTGNMYNGNISRSDCVCVGYGMFFGIYLEPLMTLVLIGKGLVLEGWPSKIEVCWVLGIWYMYGCNTFYMLTQLIFATVPSRHNQRTFDSFAVDFPLVSMQLQVNISLEGLVNALMELDERGALTQLICWRNKQRLFLFIISWVQKTHHKHDVLLIYSCWFQYFEKFPVV